MIDPDCQRYLEDPEANAGHLAHCAECKAIASGLGEEPAARAIEVHPESLPLAPWEGASYRSWPLVAGGALTVLALTIGCALATGVTPVHVVDAGLVSVDGMRAFIVSSATSLHHASLAGQIGFGALFVIVNGALFALLRRAPRGTDA